jgi:hypothetical protein
MGSLDQASDRLAALEASIKRVEPASSSELDRLSSAALEQYRDVTDSHHDTVVYVSGVPPFVGDAALKAAFCRHGEVLRTLMKSIPDDTNGNHQSWALVVFGDTASASKARFAQEVLVEDDTYQESTRDWMARLQVERVGLIRQLSAASEWHASHAQKQAAREMVGAWRELCTIRVDDLSATQAKDQPLRDAYGKFGPLLEVSCHAPIALMGGLKNGFWALLRFRNPESAGRAAHTPVTLPAHEDNQLSRGSSTRAGEHIASTTQMISEGGTQLFWNSIFAQAMWKRRQPAGALRAESAASCQSSTRPVRSLTPAGSPLWRVPSPVRRRSWTNKLRGSGKS